MSCSRSEAVLTGSACQCVLSYRREAESIFFRNIFKYASSCMTKFPFSVRQFNFTPLTNSLVMLIIAYWEKYVHSHPQQKYLITITMESNLRSWARFKKSEAFFSRISSIVSFSHLDLSSYKIDCNQ